MATTKTKGYWASIKYNIKSLVALPRAIDQEIREVTMAVKAAIKKSDNDLVIQLRRKRFQLTLMQPKAEKTSKTITKYLPTWTKTLGDSENHDLGLIVSITLGIAAITGLAYVAVTGMKTLKEFVQERKILVDLKSKALTLPEARALISAGKAGPVIKTGSIGGLGVMPMILGAGALIGGAYLMSTR